MIDTGYHFIYKLPGTKEDIQRCPDLVVIKHSKYKLERINDKIEEFVLSDLAYPNQINFLGLLEKNPHLILDIYLAMNSDKYEVSTKDPMQELPEDILEIECDYDTSK